MKSTLRNMVLSLTAISATMGCLLGAVHHLTADAITDAQLNTQRQALMQVLPPFDNNPLQTVAQVDVDGLDQPLRVYTAQNGGQTVGYAVESYTMDGFSGQIDIMVGFDTDGRVTGYHVLRHAETPGLGAKADTWFSDQTGQRSIIGTDSELAVAKDGGAIDGITAATITSRAFLGAVNSARQAIERIEPKTAN